MDIYQFKQDLVIYISGPISGDAPNTTRAIRKERFNKCERWINEHLPEWRVVNPLNVGACDGGCVDDVTRDFDGHTWECWLRFDLKAMLDCSGIVMLPFWQASEGAKLEYQVARSIGMLVYHANDDGRIVTSR